MLGQVLKQMKLITESQVQEALAKQRTDGGAIGGILVELGYITDDELTMALGAQVGMEIVDLEAILDDIPPDVVDRISPTMATIYKIVPVAFDEASNVLTVAMADSTKLESLDDLRVLLDCDVRGGVSNPSAVSKALEKYYADEQESIMDIISQLEEDSEALEVMGTASESIDLESLEEMANTAPVRKLLKLVLLQAIKDKASDIHFEPFEEELKIRYRIEGVLYEMVPPPKQLSLALTSRIKVMSNLTIAERRRPQAGRVELHIG